MNLYASLGEYKLASRLPPTVDTVRDPARLLALDAASRRTDRETGRVFYTSREARLYDGLGGNVLYLDGDLLGEPTVGPADGDALVSDEGYYLYPIASPRKRRIDFGSSVAGRRSLSVDGVWGYSDDVVRSGSVGSAGVDASATSMAMAANHGLTGGETIRVETEDLYVSAVVSNTLTVVRGVNGFTAAAHAAASPVYRRVYPADITEAVIMEAGRILREAETGQSQEIGGMDLGGYPNGNFALVRSTWNTYRIPVTG